jgi:hypothetical protein
MLSESVRVVAVLNALTRTQHSLFCQKLFNFEAKSFVFGNILIETIAARKGAFVKLVQFEDGADIVDKKIYNTAPLIDKKKDEPEKKG